MIPSDDGNLNNISTIWLADYNEDINYDLIECSEADEERYVASLSTKEKKSLLKKLKKEAAGNSDKKKERKKSHKKTSRKEEDRPRDSERSRKKHKKKHTRE